MIRTGEAKERRIVVVISIRLPRGESQGTAGHLAATQDRRSAKTSQSVPSTHTQATHNQIWAGCGCTCSMQFRGQPRRAPYGIPEASINDEKNPEREMRWSLVVDGRRVCRCRAWACWLGWLGSLGEHRTGRRRRRRVYRWRQGWESHFIMGPAPPDSGL